MHATLYSLTQSSKRGQVLIKKIDTPSISNHYTAMTVLPVGKNNILIGYNQKQNTIDTWKITNKNPWLTKITNTFEFKGQAWDDIEGFILGNNPYIKAYAAKKGEFAFFPIEPDLSNKSPLHLYHPRTPNTIELTMTKMINNQGQVAVMGYNGTNGDINIWTLSVTAQSDGAAPPLVTIPVWVHQWAKGWTRFAFFTFGSNNFFLKTNTWKPNVNIDSLSSVLSAGTFEVGTYLDLKDSQKINLVNPIYLGVDDPYPYFVTYIEENGAVTVNRIHADCKGWTCEAEEKCITNANIMVTYRNNDQNFMLLL